MASSTKSTPSLQVPITPPPLTAPTPVDPLLIAAIHQLESMDPMQMARAAGQALYDLAIQDPVISVASPEILGQTLRITLLDDKGSVFPHHYPLLKLYLSHSLVARDPRLVAVAITRITTVQLYATGKLTNAHQANPAAA